MCILNRKVRLDSITPNPQHPKGKLHEAPPRSARESVPPLGPGLRHFSVWGLGIWCFGFRIVWFEAAGAPIEDADVGRALTVKV